MQQRDLNKEAFLWHAMTSPEYLDRSYAKLTEAAEYLRQRVEAHEFIRQYEPVPRWLGEMERLEDTYANARAMLAHGEYTQMRRWAGTLKNIPRGFAESNMNWMPLDQQDHFRKTLDKAFGVASRYMDATQMSALHFRDPESDWRIDEDHGYEGSSIQLSWEKVVGGATEMPEYTVDPSLSCTTGELVPWTGVWIPAGGPDTAALAFAQQGQIMQPAYEVFFTKEDPDFEQTRPDDVTWHPFRPTGRMLPLGSDKATDPLRVPAGQLASQSGYWHTPAKQGSRRFFKQGDTFPAIEGSSYGATFWQWAPDQSDPKL